MSEPITAPLSEFADAMERNRAAFIDAVTTTAILGEVLAMAYGIAAYVGPREWLGWTRRKWKRERRRFNADRRRYPLRVVRVDVPEDREVLAMLRKLGDDWRAVSPAHAPPSRRSFAAYVEDCLMDGRVPMVRA